MNFYKLLGVPFNATEDEIKKAYRKKVKLFHPDINPNGKEIFKILNLAYETLTDPQKRLEYDKLINKSSPIRFVEEKIFDFLGFTDKPQKGSDIKTTVEITLEEGILQKEKTIVYKRKVKCPECEGNGITKESIIEKCDKCKGLGRVNTKIGNIVCLKCLGKGFIVKNPCKTCQGLGYVKKDQYLTFKVPLGVQTGDKLRVKNMGNEGINGGESGDLIIKFKLNTGIYEKFGTDLILKIQLEKDLSHYQYIRVKNPLKETIEVKIPAGISKGTLLKIKGEGYITKSGTRTDLYIKFV